MMRRRIKGIARGRRWRFEKLEKGSVENIELKLNQSGRLHTMFALFTESDSQVAASHRKCRRLQALPAREHNPMCHAALYPSLFIPRHDPRSQYFIKNI